MSALDTKEGWQAECHYSQRVYHYINNTMALCRRLGFYQGELTADQGGPRRKSDCAKCYRILRAQEGKAGVKS